MLDEICHLKDKVKPAAHNKLCTSVGLKRPTQLILPR